MPGEFEKEMQDRVAAFNLSPSPQVWEQVEASLPEDKRKRRLIFWWLPMMLLMGGSIWYFLVQKDPVNNPGMQEPRNNTNAVSNAKNPVANSDNKSGINQANTQKQRSSSTVFAEHRGNGEPANISQDANDNTGTHEQKTVIAPQKHGKRTNATPSKKQFSTNNIPPADNMNSKENYTFNNAGPAIKKEQASEEVAATAARTPIQRIPAPIEPSVIIASGIPMAGEQSAGIFNDPGLVSKIIIPNDPGDPQSPGNSPQVFIAKPHEKKKNHPVYWRLYVAAGASNTRENMIGNSEKAVSMAQSSFSNSSGLSSNMYGAAVQASAGFSYAIGAERIQQIGKHWQWYASVQYNHLSNEQATGSKKDSALTIDQNKSTVSSFYYPGNSINHTNSVYRAGLQTGIQYLVNPRSKRPVSFRTGLTADWQFSTRHLLQDNFHNAFYYSPSATRDFTTGMSVGVEWILGKNLTAAAFYQYNFSSINKEAIGTNLHWALTAVKISIPLGAH